MRVEGELVNELHVLLIGPKLKPHALGHPHVAISDKVNSVIPDFRS